MKTNWYRITPDCLQQCRQSQANLPNSGVNMAIPASEPTETRTDWPVIGGRCQPEVIRLIDMAATAAGQTRADYLINAARTQAERDLAELGMLEGARKAAASA